MPCCGSLWSVRTAHTLTQLRALKLDGMARAFEEQLTVTANDALSLEERFGLLVDREMTWRDSKRLPSIATTLPSAKVGSTPPTQRRKRFSTARRSSKPNNRPKVSCDGTPCANFRKRRNHSRRSLAQASMPTKSLTLASGHAPWARPGPV